MRLFALWKISLRFTNAIIQASSSLYESSKQLIKKSNSYRRQPGQVQRFDTEYERNGTCNIFLSCEPLSWRDVEVTDSRTKVDWARYLKNSLMSLCGCGEDCAGCDNLNTHNASSFYEILPPREARRIVEKLEFHYTPSMEAAHIAEIESFKPTVFGSAYSR